MKKLVIGSATWLALAGLAIGAGGCTVESAPPATVVQERVVAEPAPAQPVMVYYQGRWVRPWRGYRYTEGEPLMVYREGRWTREPRGYRRAEWRGRENRRYYGTAERRQPRGYAQPRREHRVAEPARGAERGRMAPPGTRSNTARTMPGAEGGSPRVRSTKVHTTLPNKNGGPAVMGRRAPIGVMQKPASPARAAGASQPASPKGSKHSGSKGSSGDHSGSGHHHEGGGASSGQ
jgi:hypothetical protein